MRIKALAVVLVLALAGSSLANETETSAPVAQNDINPRGGSFSFEPAFLLPATPLDKVVNGALGYNLNFDIGFSPNISVVFGAGYFNLRGRQNPDYYLMLAPAWFGIKSKNQFLPMAEIYWEAAAVLYYEKAYLIHSSSGAQENLDGGMRLGAGYDIWWTRWLLTGLDAKIHFIYEAGRIYPVPELGLRLGVPGMKYFALILATGFLALAACGQNPLLKMAAADYAPIKVGSKWDYAVPAGGTFTRQVIVALNHQGKDAYQIDTYSAGLTSTAYVAHTGATLETYSGSLGWTVYRRLPYVLQNRWDIPSSIPNESYRLLVDGNEDVVTPAGTYKNCYRLRQETRLTDPGTGAVLAYTSAFIWVAPDVGDVKSVSVDAAGNQTVTSEILAYSPGS